ncbi:hypothetical protein BU23DRAFT_184778 [Bimuria novae-zelandiae CBS 107.79]|uniref:Uncharacterized protein n=1 Tax=Bimuria novae-zelandiae CBS 107.79 TaxID=1447943 RepID=A0A6A5V4Q9_9PLEO|nr:hypothetical protein BU23DRAFT_184778 [Bimuria novae-zelandiae CBS 107.79]
MEPRKRDQQDDCCNEYHRMLESCLIRDEDFGNRTIYVRNLHLPTLPTSCRECALCETLLAILQGRDGVAVAMTQIYNNSSLHQSRVYDEKWNPEATELIPHGREVSVILKTWLPQPTNDLKFYNQLRIQFTISLREQNLGRSQDVVVNEKLNVFILAMKPNEEYGIRSHDMDDRHSGVLVGLVLDERLEMDQKLALIQTWLEQDLKADAMLNGLHQPISHLSNGTLTSTAANTVLPARLRDVSADGVARLKEIY